MGATREGGPPHPQAMGLMQGFMDSLDILEGVEADVPWFEDLSEPRARLPRNPWPVTDHEMRAGPRAALPGPQETPTPLSWDHFSLLDSLLAEVDEGEPELLHKVEEYEAHFRLSARGPVAREPGRTGVEEEFRWRDPRVLAAGAVPV